MSAELDALVKQVAATISVEQSALVAINGLRDQLIAAGTDPVKLAALTDDLKKYTDPLAQGIATEPPVVVPEVPA